MAPLGPTELMLGEMEMYGRKVLTSCHTWGRTAPWNAPARPGTSPVGPPRSPPSLPAGTHWRTLQLQGVGFCLLLTLFRVLECSCELVRGCTLHKPISAKSPILSQPTRVATSTDFPITDYHCLILEAVWSRLKKVILKVILFTNSWNSHPKEPRHID